MAYPLDLFSDKHLEAFDAGQAKMLVSNRNPYLGSLLNSERAVYYAQILYRMLVFRRDHELEPLHEDLFYAVKTAQQALSGEEYTWELFNQELIQLANWSLITSRMEKERIRGYKDTRKTKFRYSLTEESIAFLQWLEERLQEDFTDSARDARDLLEEISGTVKELGRLLRANRNREPEESAARRILYQIYKCQQITLEIGENLGEFNARLIGFLLRDYELSELRELLSSLHAYVEKYLNQIAGYREVLLPEIRKFIRPKYQQTLSAAYEVMERENRFAPRMLRSSRERLVPTPIPAGLLKFYRESGALESLCHRINNSALKLWRRMSAHLKELERKSHRLEGLRARINELAGAESFQVPHAWLNGLLSWGHMRGDMHEWTSEVKADPPLPRRTSWKTGESPATYLRAKEKGGEAVQSMEEARLEKLKLWLEQKILPDPDTGAILVSKGEYDTQEDFPRILDLSKTGILNNGKKLRRIGYRLTSTSSKTGIKINRQRLDFNEMELSHANKKP